MRRTGVKTPISGLVCPCGTPVLLEPAPARTAPTDQHDGPLPLMLKPCERCGRLLVVADPNVGRVVKGKWRLERRLGQGGMGSVYLANELAVDRPVALKFLHRNLAEQDEYRTRFEQEARIMARIEHPNLAHLYGVERDGLVPFMVMRYVSGRPLSKVMESEGAMSLERALPLVVQVAAALSALHARGYVHRDLKPGNVMVADDGHVTLLDFGLTRSFSPNLTQPGIALGSPLYMSPEQAMAGPLDARSDLYTLGLVTSELVVGHRPYKEDSSRPLLLQHLSDTPEPAHVGNPQVPEALSQVLLKAMSKRASDRQPSVEVFVEQLLSAAGTRPVALPRRETAEAMLAGVARLGDGAVRSLELVEVAEVVGPTTAKTPPPGLRTAPGAHADAQASPSTIRDLRRVGEQVTHPARVLDEVPAPEGKRTTRSERPPAALPTEKVPAWTRAGLPTGAPDDALFTEPSPKYSSPPLNLQLDETAPLAPDEARVTLSADQRGRPEPVGSEAPQRADERSEPPVAPAPRARASRLAEPRPKHTSPPLNLQLEETAPLAPDEARVALSADQRGRPEPVGSEAPQRADERSEPPVAPAPRARASRLGARSSTPTGTAPRPADTLRDTVRLTQDDEKSEPHPQTARARSSLPRGHLPQHGPVESAPAPAPPVEASAPSPFIVAGVALLVVIIMAAVWFLLS
ncbi:MAG: protein kinase [Myxococcaceae bacterium]|nr:protein kinase [Myxococcaceae bacterium]